MYNKFIGNTVTGFGAAIAVLNTNVEIIGNTVKNNTSGFSGAINITTGVLELPGPLNPSKVITHNFISAFVPYEYDIQGPGLATINIEDSVLLFNSAGSGGGGVSLTGNGQAASYLVCDLFYEPDCSEAFLAAFQVRQDERDAFFMCLDDPPPEGCGDFPGPPIASQPWLPDPSSATVCSSLTIDDDSKLQNNGAGGSGDDVLISNSCDYTVNIDDDANIGDCDGPGCH